MTNEMLRNAKALRHTYESLYHETAEGKLLDTAYHAYLMLCASNITIVEYTPSEFINKCKANKEFYNYYLAYAN